MKSVLTFLALFFALAAQAGPRATRDYCANLGTYYWEIGDRNGRLASGSVTDPGDTPITADTVLDVESASKWIYAAYVAETKTLDARDLQFLRLTSGYDDFGLCTTRQTVASCAAAGDNDLLTTSAVGKFFYGGGHFQQHGVPTLGPLDAFALGNAISSTLGLTIPYRSPQLAAGASISSSVYAAFLRKLMDGSLRLPLGSSPVCTNPSTCSTALSTPIPASESWHYSLGHWVEDDPVVGDGAFSSLGAFGFYPWITADKSTYGLIARHGITTWQSVQCGRQMRKAWVH